ncbi:MAG: poly-gamma-glutamate hydrolase family protein [Candidatus Colwellbacteria bacterium]|nr:poly-gamma-glutamate hydrolase family protein [Candidatus Colwellbacteria bacterium]
MSIHGEHDTAEAFVMVGGLDKTLAERVENQFKDFGFSVLVPPDELNGDDPENICNKGKSGKGVQIEISKELREVLHNSESTLSKFVDALRRGILA